MPAKKTVVKFSDGREVKFPPPKPRTNRTRAQVKARMTNLDMHPKVIAKALEKYDLARKK